MSKQRSQVTVLIKTNSDAAVPVRLSAEQLPVRYAAIWGKKAARTNNTGIVYLGPSATNDTQPQAIAAGAMWEVEDVDLSDFYLDVATTGDGVVILYW